MRSFLRGWFSRWVVAAVFIGTAAGPGRAAEASALVKQADAALSAWRLPEALAAAQAAVQADPRNIDAYYFLALAYCGAKQFDAAEQAMTGVRALAPGERKKQVDDVMALIKKFRQSDALAQAAEGALADGLTAKAAGLYAEAFAKSFHAPELGLAGAELYARRLDLPVEAAALWREVQLDAAKYQDLEAWARAEAGLKDITGRLRGAVRDYLARAEKEGDPERAASLLKWAERADPDYPEIYLARARVAASADLKDPTALLAALKELSKRDLAAPERIAALPNMVRWWLKEGDKGGAVKRLVADIVGGVAAEKIASGQFGDDREASASAAVETSAPARGKGDTRATPRAIAPDSQLPPGKGARF